jgi:hypothetical protein
MFPLDGISNLAAASPAMTDQFVSVIAPKRTPL